jgi:hypothetical protein
MMGQRRAKSCKLDMAPPPGELWRAVVIDKARSVAGDAFMRKGHIERD